MTRQATDSYNFFCPVYLICKICKIYKFLDCFSFFVLRKKIKIAYSVNENTEKKEKKMSREIYL